MAGPHVTTQPKEGKTADLLIGSDGYPYGRCSARSRQLVRNHPDWPYEKLRCKLPCVPGRRNCRIHGGMNPGPMTKKGSMFYHDHVPLEIRDTYREFLQDPAWADLQGEIALIRATLTSYMENIEEINTISAQQHIASLAEKVASLVEKKHKIEYGEKYVININTLVLYAAKIADIINSYVEDEDVRIAIRDELDKAFGGVANIREDTNGGIYPHPLMLKAGDD